MIILAIDPGSKTSGTGVAVLNITDKEKPSVLQTYELLPLQNASFPIIAQGIIWNVMLLIQVFKPDVVVVEEPFLQGLANKRMMKFLGVLEVELSKYDAQLQPVYISPRSVKKIVSGSGKAEKHELANCIISMVKNKRMIIKLIKEKRFDETDAIAIGLAFLRKDGIDNEKEKE